MKILPIATAQKYGFRVGYQELENNMLSYCIIEEGIQSTIVINSLYPIEISSKIILFELGLALNKEKHYHITYINDLAIDF